MTKNILLTGSGGFVGGNIKKYLEKDFNILSPRSFELNCISEEAVKEYFKKNKIRELARTPTDKTVNTIVNINKNLIFFILLISFLLLCF